jgi:single-strand DNA-binding protein
MFSQTIVVGYLGRDPEQRFTPSGQSVTNFSVATSRSWTDAAGEKQEKTTWFKVTTWGKLSELCAQYLSKGRMVLVEGEIDASAWSDKGGDPRATLELNARNVRFLGGGNGEGGEKPAAKPAAKPASKQAPPPTDYDEEDIPF